MTDTDADRAAFVRLATALESLRDAIDPRPPYPRPIPSPTRTSADAH